MGRSVLVTGGSRGIGLAVAEAFIQSGDEVTLTGRDPERLASSGASLGARTVVADAGEPGDISALADVFADGVDVVVNNAGAFIGRSPRTGDPVDAHADHWLATLRVNLLGAVLTVAALEDLIRPGGAVVSIGSIGAEYASNAYATAKAGLAAWNAGASARLGRRDITANVVSPGYIEDTDLFGDSMSDERRTSLIERTHGNRAGRPADVAALVHFLASTGARHITGQTLHVNGGAHTTR